MVDRVVTVPDNMELPAVVKVPASRLTGTIDAARLPGSTGASPVLDPFSTLPPSPTAWQQYTYRVDSSTTYPGSIEWASGAPVITGWGVILLFWNGSAWSGEWAEMSASAPVADLTPPTAGTLAASGVSGGEFTLTVTGASDAGIGLHAQPYAFRIDGGTWSAWQSSPSRFITGQSPATAYACQHKVRDAAGNEATGTAIDVVTATAPAGPIAFTWQGLATTPSGNATTPATATAVSIGTASSTRTVVAAVALQGGSNWAAATGVTIGGVTAVKDVETMTTSGGTGLWRAIVPTGTTADIVISCDRAFNGGNIGVWTAPILATRIDGKGSATSPLSVTPDATADGAVLAAATVNQGAPTWTGVTQRGNVAGKLATADAAATGTPATVGISGTGILIAASYAGVS